MAKRSPHSFKKWDKENKRKRKSQEKMARRQGKKKQADGEDKPEMTTKPSQKNDSQIATFFPGDL
jgi:hypothetical protein